ncbi:MAG: hypothetical protein QM731_05465 [Chitinophagaceae bacterium]
MKQITYPKDIFAEFIALARAVIVFAVLLPACKKNGGTPGGGGSNSDVYYPATLSFYEGNNSSYPSRSSFKYDDKHLLTYMGNSGRYSNISDNGVQQVILSGSDTLIIANLFSGDIYTGKGVDQIKTNYMWKYSTGNSTTGPVSTYYFTNTDATNNFLGSYNGGTYTQSFKYDGNGNLTTSTFVTNSSGSPTSTNYDPGGLLYDKITYKGYDDKPSPYSAVAGYRYISWQWAYPWQFYFSMSKHNPTQIIEESLNTTTMVWSVYSQSDLTYTYNDQGYPSQVKITTVYPSTGTPTQAFYQTYNFTYAK